MSDPRLISSVVGLITFALYVITIRSVSKRLKHEQAQRQLQENWLRHNLRAIRARAMYAFPEAVSVCNTLETALPARSHIDLEGLDRHLCALRRRHNTELLESARHPDGSARVRDMLTQIAVAANAAGMHGIEAHACSALALLRNPEAFGTLLQMADLNAEQKGIGACKR